MKNKKNRKTNRNTRKNIPYTPGRNMFGDKAETRFVVLKRETAYEQMVEAMTWMFKGASREVTYDATCFAGHEDERKALLERIKLFVTLRTSLSTQRVYHVDIRNSAA